MSLYKAIEYGKEKRRAYRKSKAFDTSCRNHGSCDYCKSDRQYKFIKAELSAKEQLEEYKNDSWNESDDYDEDDDWDNEIFWYLQEKKKELE
jgi:hypothetical protein